MTHITIQTIPHAEQRYPTVGDWVWVDDHNLQIRVSHLGDRRYEALAAVHELVEALLCREHGITTEMVDAFDRAFEGFGEPGFAPDCPYRREHTAATGIEMHLALAMGGDWVEYDNAVMSAVSVTSVVEGPPLVSRWPADRYHPRYRKGRIGGRS